MKTISIEETVEIECGVLVVGAAVGALVGVTSTFISAGNTGQIAAATILGGVAGFYGGLGMWGSSAATGIFMSVTTLGGGGGGALKLQYQLK